ncbi:hypothetical protein B0H17DRAFT_1125788 [Mycena rosella]|uniref:Uncharacterized protein n=1 Tax=Mycena rosella TaxID=1033263 RepID=A0AAD7GVD1_MYCRO|nr:hypothetical protein B0H17DRAFT_1125788 [Mycena rosella]
MQYATVRYPTSAPNHGYQPRMRRNTMEPSGRRPNSSNTPTNTLMTAAASCEHRKKKVAIDVVHFDGADLSCCVEERIQQDLERALRAQRRNKARKVARASKAAEQAADSACVDWQQAPNVRRPSIVQVMATNESAERGRLQGFKFPQLNTKPQRPPPLKFPATAHAAPPLPSPKRLAPLPRFNPFVRARSESLSSLIEDEPPARERRNASVSALFARIHREAEYMRLRQG